MAATRNHISLIEYKDMKFLITDRPTDASLERYLNVSVSLSSFVLAKCRSARRY